MTFEEKLTQALKETFEERVEQSLASTDKHRFSLSYRIWERKMLRDLSRGRRDKIWTLRKVRYAAAAMTAAFSLLICGTAFAATVLIGRFSFDNKVDYSKLFIENLSSDKTRIEEYYGLPEEDGWVCTDFDELTDYTIIRYTRGDEIVIFSQEIIRGNMGNVNTENAVVEPMSIYEENDGFFIEFQYGECGLWWIYDGYLFSITGNIDKSVLVNLAHSTKIVKF